MILRDVLFRARQILSDNNIEDASLEGELLVRYALGISRAQLFSDLLTDISEDTQKTILRLVDERISGRPLAYIIGHREFYGYDFIVDERVLIPRPETELLVEKALRFAETHPVHTVADIGTGSGCIAITLALQIPVAVIYAVDSSSDALKVAELNCRNHDVTSRIHLLQGPLTNPLPERVDLLAANLPYVTRADMAQVNTRGFEPEQALNGGVEGLDFIEPLCRQLGIVLNPGGLALLEIGYNQGTAVLSLLNTLYPDATITVYKDFQGIDRLAALEFTG